MGNLRKNLSLLILICFIVSLFTIEADFASAEFKVIVVPDNYSTIQEAINHANDGDTIFFKKGHYEGPLNKTLEINKAIKLNGEDRNGTILNLSPPLVPMSIFTYEYMGYLAAIEIDSNNVEISGLTINAKGGSISAKSDYTQIVDVNATLGISIEGAHSTITRVTLKGGLSIVGKSNTVTDNYFETALVTPLFGCVGSNNIIANNTLATKNETYNIKLNVERTNNLIANNLLSTIHLKGSQNIIYKNSIKAVPGDSGIYLSHSSANTIYANRITYAESITYQQEGIFLSESSDNIIYANHIESVFKGVYLQNTDTEPMVTNNNTFYHNIFINNQIQAWDYTSSTSNTFDNGKEGNYWSTYSGIDANNDGIGDSPYNPTSLYVYGDVEKVTECSPDNYPLMVPVDIDNVTIEFPEWANNFTNPEPTPNVPEFPSSIVLIVVLSAVSILLVIGNRKLTSKFNNHTDY